MPWEDQRLGACFSLSGRSWKASSRSRWRRGTTPPTSGPCGRSRTSWPAPPTQSSQHLPWVRGELGSCQEQRWRKRGGEGAAGSSSVARLHSERCSCISKPGGAEQQPERYLALLLLWFQENYPWCPDIGKGGWGGQGWRLKGEPASGSARGRGRMILWLRWHWARQPMYDPTSPTPDKWISMKGRALQLKVPYMASARGPGVDSGDGGFCSLLL